MTKVEYRFQNPVMLTFELHPARAVARGPTGVDAK